MVPCRGQVCQCLPGRKTITVQFLVLVLPVWKMLQGRGEVLMGALPTRCLVSNLGT